MKSIQTSSGKITLEEILKGIAGLKLPDFDDFRAKIEQLAKQKKPPAVSEKEKMLINKIKEGGPNEDWRDKYDRLSAKVTHGNISESEHNELLQMVPISEQWTFERLQLIIELSNLWETDLDDVLKRLKIKPRENSYV